MTKRKYFGTDGIRGVANTAPITPEIAMKVGQAAGHIFRRKSSHARPSVVIGKDTRLSGYMVESALQAGFTSVGFYCLLVGPIPTPAVSFLTRSLRSDMGVMISASHNPFADNGIKIFGPDGFKLSDDLELQIESLVDNGPVGLAPPDKIGRAVRIDDATGRYMEFCKTAIGEDIDLNGMRLVVDCANGATYKSAPKLFWELGAQVIRIGTEPDGYNINRGCGALDTKALSKAVINNGADLGIALDGDGDRLIICDEKGNILDGDQIMAVIATHMHKHGKLTGKGIVATQMSNMGLEKYCEGMGLDLIRTNVGDRYVMEAMREKGCNFGGEASGHLIFLDHATTGDGTLAALKFLEVMREQGVSASALGSCFKPFPQRLENVRIPNKKLADAVMNCDEVRGKIEESTAKLNGMGRVLVRKSGTEPVIRVMVEAEKISTVEAHVSGIVETMQVTSQKM